MLQLTFEVRSDRDEPVYFAYSCDSLSLLFGLDVYLLSPKGDRLYLDNPSERPDCEPGIRTLTRFGLIGGQAVIDGMAYTTSGEAVPLEQGRHRVVVRFTWAPDRESLLTSPVHEQRILSFEWHEEFNGR